MHFQNNNASTGSVLAYSTITLEASEFDSNCYSVIRGVLYSYNSTITVKASEFDGNSVGDGGVL